MRTCSSHYGSQAHLPLDSMEGMCTECELCVHE